MLMQDLPLAPPERHPVRHLVAGMLRAAGRLLDGLASALVVPTPQRNPDAVLEFYAEAGAPEGALYVDGEWVGNLLGVTRL